MNKMKTAVSKLLPRTLVLLVSLLLTQLSFAQGGRAGNDDKEGPPANAIDQRTGEILVAAVEFINADQPAEARAKLGELNLERLSPYERSRVEQMLANLDQGDGNFAGVRSHLQAAIDSGGMNDQEITASSYAIAQSWIAEENWTQGAVALEEYIRTTAMPGSAPYYLLAVAYYQQEKLDEALPHIKKAVELTNPPQESWLSLLLGILIQKENYREAIGVLEQMIALNPDKKDNWMTLSNIYATLEDYDQALVIMQFADYNGFVTEDSEIRRFSDMMMVAEMPFQAAELMEAAGEKNQVEKDIKYYEGLANSWIAAREFRKALPVLGEAAKLSDNGQIFQRIGEVNIQLSEWNDAATALKSALDKGGLRDEAQAQLYLGTALYNQEKCSEAKPYFERARNSASARGTANSYIALIESRAESCD
jgi:tetratricopeptide (TPR) repeat protein